MFAAFFGASEPVSSSANTVDHSSQNPLLDHHNNHNNNHNYHHNQGGNVNDSDHGYDAPYEDPVHKKVMHASIGYSEVGDRQVKWKWEYVYHMLAFFIAAFTFIACFVWIPRSPSVSVKRTNIVLTDTVFNVQQTYSVSNRNVYSQRIKDFVPHMKFISSSTRRVYTSVGVLNITLSPDIDQMDFSVRKTLSKTLVMDYSFSLSVQDAEDASAQCNSDRGIYLTIQGSFHMQTFGKNYDSINFGLMPTLVHCNAEISQSLAFPYKIIEDQGDEEEVGNVDIKDVNIQ